MGVVPGLSNRGEYAPARSHVEFHTALDVRPIGIRHVKVDAQAVTLLRRELELHLRGVEDPQDDAILMHIHAAARGVNGGVVFDILPLGGTDDDDDLKIVDVQRKPKGLSQETADLVGAAIRETGELSATECGERVGISRVSARRYLEHFVNTGQADVRLRYGSTGRPERRYRWVG